ncbi:MAG TPA: MFS transporter [Candidatus Limnocylindrales bacterium]|nr:MFS transporter [Candidatus Limnocylindrales bacterium]
MTPTQRGALAAAIIGSAVVFLDGTIVNLALPRIGATLPAVGIGVLEGQVYVVAGYMATLAAFLLLAGALGDRYGWRRTFVLGLAGFGVASLVCGVAPSLDVLAIARLAQGITGALLVPGSLAIITRLFEGPARARAIGIWTASTSLVAVLGPPIGGVLVDTFGWRSIFLVNLPLVGLGILLAWRFLPTLRAAVAPTRFDWLGAVVAVVAVGGLSFGAIRGQQVAWSEPGPLLVLAIGAVALVAFPVLMLVRRDPLVPPALFRNRTFRTINLATLLIYAALYVTFYIQSLFLQGVLGYSPLAAAIVGLPAGLALIGLSAWAGTLAGRFGARPFLVAGPLLMAAGSGLWLRVPATSTAWDARLSDLASLVPPLAVLVDPLPSIVLFGVGIALVVAPLTSTLMASAPVERAGLASAINNALSRVGQPLASAGIFIVVTERFYATLGARVPGLDPASPELRAAVQPLNRPADGVAPAIADAARAASAEAFHATMLVLAGLLVAGAVVSWLGLPRDASGTHPTPDGAHPGG